MKVLIIQRVIPDYRKAFFERLYSELTSDGISLSLLCGSPQKEEALQDASGGLPFGTKTQHMLFPGGAYWTARSWEMASHADMVIVEQANAPLQNHALILRRGLQSLCLRKHHPLLAFWGCGWDFIRGNRHELSEWYKRMILRNVDWWFAYTVRTQQYVSAAGYPLDRITVVNNSTDASALRKAVTEMTDERIDQIFCSLFPSAVRSSCLLGVFCSRLIDSKHIRFLLRSSALIHEYLPAFRLVVIGDGPLRPLVEEFCHENSWCISVGRVSGLERAPYLKMAEIWLCPGEVGLEVIDAFAAGLPICTTLHDQQGPEIAYISNGNNGIITERDASQYARNIADLLSSSSELNAMKCRAAQDSIQYGIEQMVDRFHYGIVQCLKMLEE